MDAEQKLAEIRRKTRERNKRYYEANKVRLNKKRMERYRNDSEAREKQKEACKRYYQNKKEQNKDKE